MRDLDIENYESDGMDRMIIDSEGSTPTKTPMALEIANKDLDSKQS